MAPKPSADLVAAAAHHEREWCYELWLARSSFSQIRIQANRPAELGGLGYDLSLNAVKGLVLAAREARGDLGMSRVERIERQAAEIDERARAARYDFGAAYTRAAALDRAIDGFEVYDADTATALRGMLAERAALGADVERADRRLDVAQAREAKLHGLDAPTEARLEVTTRDAVTEELNAMLARVHTGEAKGG